MKHFMRYYFPALFWALLIFTVSSIHKLPTDPTGTGFVDKIAHFLEYFILGFFMAHAFYNMSNKKHSFWRYFIAAFLGVAYAASDEWHQSFVPGRHMDVGDFIADSFGVIIAQFVYEYNRTKLQWFFSLLKPRPISGRQD